MSQCEKILKNSERCSNPAVPGTTVCEKHKPRITFHPVQRPTTEHPQEAPTSGSSDRAEPSAAGQPPTFPGLYADERNILVAPRAIVLIPTDSDSHPSRQFTRLVRLLGALSQTLTLPGHVRLYRREEADDLLIELSLDNGGDISLASLYDMIAWTVGQWDGRLYIGQDRGFVRYRDASAPRGYDAAGFQPPQDPEKLWLVDRDATREISLGEFSEWPLVDVLMQVAPVPGADDPIPAQVHVLAPPALHPLLSRYFHAHHLHYQLARVENEEDALILFELSPRLQAPAGRTVPPFVLDYLTRLPRVTVLVLAQQNDTRCILLQWRHRYPLHLDQVADAFEPATLVLLMADPYANRCIAPAPQFIDGDLLTRFHGPRPSAASLTPQPANQHPDLQLRILLRADNGPVPPVAALIVASRELGWLRPLLYRLPRGLFRACSLCLGQDRAVLVADELPLTGIPFGLPLRRIGDTALFIPLRRRLVPDLPWAILREVLDVQDGRYTFLTEDYRLDLETADFAPLSRILVADSEPPHVSLQPSPQAYLSDLDWKAPSPEPRMKAPEPRGSLKTAVSKLLRMPKPESPAEPPADTQQLLSTKLLEQARTYEGDGDYLAAAICYSLLNDPGNSARCYRHAATTSEHRR